MGKEQIKPEGEQKITIFEFKKWLDNCMNDAELKLQGLEKEEIALVIVGKTKEILAAKLAKLEKTGELKIGQESQKELPVLEFKRWLDNCVIDAKARGLDKSDIIMALMEKSQEVFVRSQIKPEKE